MNDVITNPIVVSIVGAIFTALLSGIGYILRRVISLEGQLEAIRRGELRETIATVLKEDERYRTLVSESKALIEQGVKIEIGEVSIPDDNKTLVDSGGLRVVMVPIQFKTAFSDPPQVEIGIQKLDASSEGFQPPIGNKCLGPYYVRLSLEIHDVTRAGCNAKFFTWADSKIFGSRAVYIAIGK